MQTTHQNYKFVRPPVVGELAAQQPRITWLEEQGSPSGEARRVILRALEVLTAVNGSTTSRQRGIEEQGSNKI